MKITLMQFPSSSICLADCQAGNKLALTVLYDKFNPFNASCSKLLLFEGFSAILV